MQRSPSGCIHRIFERQAECRPRSVALTFPGGRLTYAELDGFGNGIAHRILSAGARPGDVVALVAERSPESIVTILGILKAGCAYLPLDPLWPPDRMHFALTQAGARLVLTPENRLAPHPRQTSDGPAPSALTIPGVGRLQAAPPPPGIPPGEPDDPAYVMYTSGTTGRPKGVVVPHRGIVRLVINPGYMDVGPDEVFLQFATLAFDASTLEIWGAFLNGARLVVAPPPPLDYTALARTIREEKVTTIWLTSSVFHHVVEHAPETLTGVRQLLAGGEAVLPDPIRRYLAQPGHGRLIVGYGPTENTVFTAAGGFDHPEEVPATVTLGRPVRDTTVFIVNEQGALAPPGDVGEILTGGDGLALGYIHAPELTAERFIPNPFSDEPGALLYRTGDLARWRPDGTLEFHGRTDRQVKIRGYRIELQEVELNLGRHPDLTACAAMALEAPAEGRVLAAFLVAARPDLTAHALRAWLAERVPEYMIPSRFLAVDALPLTPNGKINFDALAQSGTPLPAGSGADREPRTGLECQIAGIWRAVLNRTAIAATDNFFHLGGHSLLAVQMAARLERELRISVPPYWLYDHPTVAELAAALSGAQAPAAAPLPAGEPASRAVPIPTAPIQRGVCLLQMAFPDSPAYNEPLVYRISGPAVREHARLALEAIRARHEILRTTLLWRDGRLLQQVHPACNRPMPWNECDGSALPQAERETWLRETLQAEVDRLFDLGHQDHWRARWIRLSDDDHALALTFHHGIIDEWALRLLLREFEQLYLAAGDPHRAGLPPVALQYGDYAVWQSRRLEASRLDEQRAYWRRQLAALPRPFEWPPPDGGTPTRRAAAGTVSFELPSDVVAALRGLARRNNTSSFAVVMALFAAWLHRHTGRTDFVIATAATQRNRPELQDLIGLCLNTLPIRATPADTATMGDVLEQIRDTLAGALRHGDLPFEEILSEVGADRNPLHHGLHQVMFVLLEERLPELRLGPTTWRPITIHNSGSKCELLLQVQAVGATWPCDLGYAGSCFSPAQAADMARDLAAFFARFAAAADTRLGTALRAPADARPPMPRPAAPGAPAHDTWVGRILALWESFLNRHPIGPDDDFFDLGGHSLLAIRLASVLQEGLGLPVSVRSIFEHPTPARLAAALRARIENPAAPDGSDAPPQGDLPLEVLLERQRDYVRTWAGARTHPGSFLVTRNERGRRPGLHWCLQGQEELAQLSEHLGPDQPVHGMRSGHLIMEYTPGSIAALAAHYASEIARLQPLGPILLGGNCQGGIIAREIALRLQADGRQVPLLILMEPTEHPTYGGPVALLFGRDSIYNPYRGGPQPEPIFRSAYPAGFSVDFIDGAHGQFFDPAHIESLARVVARLLRRQRPGWLARARAAVGLASSRW